MYEEFLAKRNKIITDFDIPGLIQMTKENTGESMTREVAEITLHKLRCHLAQTGQFDKELGAASGRWLQERDMWHGVRWWLLGG